MHEDVLEAIVNSIETKCTHAHLRPHGRRGCTVPKRILRNSFVTLARKEGWMNGWMDGWLDGWMDQRMDGWKETMNNCPSQYVCMYVGMNACLIRTTCQPTIGTAPTLSNRNRAPRVIWSISCEATSQSNTSSARHSTRAHLGVQGVRLVIHAPSCAHVCYCSQAGINQSNQGTSQIELHLSVGHKSAKHILLLWCLLIPPALEVCDLHQCMIVQGCVTMRGSRQP